MYDIHREGMRAYVEAVFGAWDESAQRDAFDAKYADAARAQTYTLEVLEVAGATAGYLHLEPAGDCLWLANVRVAASFRGEGLGAALVANVVARAGDRAVALRVLRGNPARNLYERLGFRVVETTETHFRMRREPDPIP